MKVLVLAVALALAGCASNPLSTATFVAKSGFAGAVESFIVYRDLCAKKALPSSCRTLVTRGQDIIRQGYALEKAGNTAALSSVGGQLAAIVTQMKGQ